MGQRHPPPLESGGEEPVKDPAPNEPPAPPLLPPSTHPPLPPPMGVSKQAPSQPNPRFGGAHGAEPHIPAPPQVWGRLGGSPLPTVPFGCW